MHFADFHYSTYCITMYTNSSRVNAPHLQGPRASAAHRRWRGSDISC